MINVRNNVNYRRAEKISSNEYFKEVNKKGKVGSKELNSNIDLINANEVDIKKDELYLKCIDKLLGEMAEEVDSLK